MANVTHMFYECMKGSQLKTALNCAIRENRKRHTKWKYSDDDDAHNDVVRNVVKNWCDPKSHTCNKRHEVRYNPCACLCVVRECVSSTRHPGSPFGRVLGGSCPPGRWPATTPPVSATPPPPPPPPPHLPNRFYYLYSRTRTQCPFSASFWQRPTHKQPSDSRHR
jgi:hypothetical protein